MTCAAPHDATAASSAAVCSRQQVRPRRVSLPVPYSEQSVNLMHFRGRADEYLKGQRRSVVFAMGMALALVLALVDYGTGYEISFAIFYVLPIAIVAWYGDLRSSIMLSIVCAVLWEEANRLAGQSYSSSAVPVWNSLTRLGFFLVIAHLLVTLRETLQREEAVSRVDALTGIRNRRAFYEQAQAELARSKRTLEPLTMVYIDLDNFKQVNDTLGHDVGDRLLQVVASRLGSGVRITDTVARMGGDEFALLLANTDESASKVVVANLHRALLADMQQRRWPVGASIGAMTCLVAPQTVDAMTRLADELMYSVKGAGKNAVRHAVHAG
jgi:diguanylate cyclase (GGDEF)-like protein